MDTETAMLAAIIAAPDEDTPRLALADWYDENGQPERAEFIRVQVAKSRHHCPYGMMAEGTNCDWVVEAEQERIAAIQARWPEYRQPRLPHCEYHVLDRREQELLARPHYDWSLPLRGFHGAWAVPFGSRKYHGGWVENDWPVRTIAFNFVRGFVGVIACNVVDWMRRGDEILQTHPVAKVTLTGDQSTPDLAARWPGVVFSLSHT